MCCRASPLWSTVSGAETLRLWPEPWRTLSSLYKIWLMHSNCCKVVTHTYNFVYWKSKSLFDQCDFSTAHVETSVFYGIMRIYLSGYRTFWSYLVIYLCSWTCFWNVCMFVSMYTCIDGKTTPACQRAWSMRGSGQKRWSFQEEVLHRAVCCTVLMNFWESNMKKKVVWWLIFMFFWILWMIASALDPNKSTHWDDSAFIGAFLTRMRNYMPPAHRQLIQDISLQPPLRSFVQQQASERLNQAFHLCVTKLLALRSYHINVVSRYITVPAARARQLRKQNLDLEGEMISRAPKALEERGTGGSGIMSFLKTVRDHTKDALLPETNQETNLTQGDTAKWDLHHLKQAADPFCLLSAVFHVSLKAERERKACDACLELCCVCRQTSA